jgi:energy-coupling factor transporter transmembrane protein EcfT
MNRWRSSGSYQPSLVENSPLRRLDPRVKLAMGLCASLMVMLPLAGLALFTLGYALLLTWARLLPAALRQVWRMRWLLLFLFVLDALLINLELAAAVTLRLALLGGVFTLVLGTTTISEFSLGLESLGLPFRYAFSLGLAFQSLRLMEEEWRAIQEAQRARGILPRFSDWKTLLRQATDLAALTVPATVLTTRRAWAVTEAASARGFDAPGRRPYRRLHMRLVDWLALALAAALTAGMFWYF